MTFGARAVMFWVVSVPVLGCGTATDDDSASALHACAPLEASYVPTAIGEGIGAGRHADGTLYLLDKGEFGYRAFVSEGDALKRKVVAGTGEFGDEWVVASVSDASAPFTLKIERSAGQPTRMGVFRGALDERDFEIGAQGDVLEIVDASAYASMPVVNLPGTVQVEYDATTPDGERLVVTRPEHDWKYEDFRVFFGTPEQMSERPVLATLTTRGSSTRLAFTVDGVEYEAFFHSSLSAEQTSTLTAAGQRRQLTILDPSATPTAGLAYRCL